MSVDPGESVECPGRVHVEGFGDFRPKATQYRVVERELDLWPLGLQAQDERGEWVDVEEYRSGCDMEGRFAPARWERIARPKWHTGHLVKLEGQLEAKANGTPHPMRVIA